MKIRWKLIEHIILSVQYSSRDIHESFRGHWLRIYHQIFKIQDGGSNMADENPKSLGIRWKSVYWGFLRSVITNPSSDFQNSRWRIQYGGRKFEKSRNWMKIGILGFLRSLITNPSSDFQNSRMRIQFSHFSLKYDPTLCEPGDNDVVVEFCLFRDAWLLWVPLPFTVRGAWL